MRLLDCKEEGCRELMKDAPQLESYLCQDCRDHFKGVLELLNVLNVPYYVDPYMVRGLDYYTNTTFEFISEDIGAQGSLGGGGRYDNLVEICGGPAVPGVGLAMGVERIALAMEKEQLWPEESEPEGVFMAVQGSGLKEEALSMLYSLRNKGLRADTDFLNRSLKAQMKFANRNGFRYVIILERKRS